MGANENISSRSAHSSVYNTKTGVLEVTKLSSAAFRSSYQPVKELLNVSDAGIKISSKVSHATSEVI
jgi:hypothetical protein